ncbi:MAG: hypothetical protein AB7H80_15710 [Candidatus Kapaibacterium sp.]
MSTSKKKLLYRKKNTQAHGVDHHFGTKYRQHRNEKNFNAKRMLQGVRRGLDYTPLFSFLLSKVGSQWNQVYSEAVSRLDTEQPIFWLVALDKSKGRGIVRIGESSYYSGLYVDDEGILQIVAPQIGPQDLEPICSCCTHTLNGIPFTKKYTGRGMSSWPEI